MSNGNGLGVAISGIIGLIFAAIILFLIAQNTNEPLLQQSATDISNLAIIGVVGIVIILIVVVIMFLFSRR